MFWTIPFFITGGVPFILVLIALFQMIEWRGEIKRHARAQFQNNSWAKFALIYAGIWIVMAIVSNLISFIPLLNVLLNMAVTGLVGYGSVDVLRKIRRGEDFTIRDFFPTDELGSVMALTFVKDIYLFLWSLLFVIPGIIKGYSYSQVYYIANENPGMSVDDIITESREMMDGHKWELFILQVSFIGWGILAALTLGLVGLYILPLYSMSLYLFHEYVKKGYLQSNTHKNVYTIY